MVELKFKPIFRGPYLKWRLKIRNGLYAGAVLLLLLLMTFQAWIILTGALQFRLWGAGSLDGHCNSQSTWCSLLTSTVGARVWEGPGQEGVGTRVGRTSVIVGITVGTKCQGQESWG